jgi:hypothetical protein
MSSSDPPTAQQNGEDNGEPKTDAVANALTTLKRSCSLREAAEMVLFKTKDEEAFEAMKETAAKERRAHDQLWKAAALAGKPFEERSAEHKRLDDSERRVDDWKRFGPYVSERAWGTVREDYSEGGNAWGYFPHEHARSRVYRWNEDGLAGVCNR